MKTFLMLLVIAALAAWGMYAAGWLTFDSSSEETQINIHKDKAKHDTEEAIQMGKQMLNDAGDSLSDDSPDERADDRPEADSRRDAEERSQAGNPS